MPTSVIEQIRGAVRDGAGLRDGELLGRFVESRDERALAALIERHGPMVWAVSRRHLSHHDAEDAFQATFIVLVRKASSITHRETVGNWLYRVARQAALQARRTSGRRGEVQVTEMPDVEAPRDQWVDVRPVLDEELSRLPDHYRAVLILSDLEGKTRKEVAAQLGCPDGTVASRLVRARAMLAKRLAQRGIALSSGALVVLSRDSATAGVPSSVVASTIKAASLFAAGRAAIPVKVAALTEGVLKAMLLTKLKTVMGVLVAMVMIGLIGFGVAAAQQKGEAVERPASEKTQKTEIVKEKEAAIAWGKEVDGLQVGLVADAGTCRQGEKFKLTVKLRNVSKADIKITYGLLTEHPPKVTTADGGKVSVYMPPPLDFYVVPTKRVIKAGETITLYSPEIAVESEARAKLDGEMLVDTPTVCVRAGTYKIAYGGMIQSHPKLTTGTVEFKVKDKASDSKSEYPTADIVVQYRDESGRDLKQFRVEDAEVVAKLASHLPGILGEKGSGPRTSEGERATLTIKFNHKSGEVSRMRVAHVTVDYGTWRWRDNTPHTGDRQVEKKDELKSLMERLATKAKVDLK